MANLKERTIRELHFYPEHKRYNNNGEWFKMFAEKLDASARINDVFGVDLRRLIANYKLYNNHAEFDDIVKSTIIREEFIDINPDDNYVHINIVSKYIKALEGLLKGRPLKTKIIAVNEDATTRKEQLKFNMIKEYVVNELMKGVNEYLQKKYGQQMQQAQQSGDNNALQQLQQQMQQEKEAMTPEEVNEYIAREHQDPAEILADQIMNYLRRKLDLRQVFSHGWKHGLISAREVYYVGIENGCPIVKVINPINIRTGGGNGFNVETSDWAVVRYKMSITDLVRTFGSELDEKKLKEISKALPEEALSAMSIFNEYGEHFDPENDIEVFHYVWKSLRKIGFLKYFDIQTGQEAETIVDDSYELDENAGDISIEWRYIIDVYEIYRIANSDVWFNYGRVKRIFDTDYMYDAQLPYIGVVYDADNAVPVSLLDRMKQYQYLYDYVANKLLKLLASDKGKKLLTNIGIIPRSHGFTTDEWLEMLDKLSIGFFDPKEEGNTYTDVNTAAKVLDLSLASDIQRYVELLQVIEEQMGISVGITRHILGQVGQNEAVGTSQMALTQSIYILEPYFAIHDYAVKNVLQYLIDTARYAYTFENDKEMLQYVLDDMSVGILKMDKDLLMMSTYGIFVSDSAKPDRILDQIIQLSQAALQNQQATFSDVLDVLRSESVAEAVEKLRKAERDAQKRMSQMQQANAQQQQQMLEAQRQLELDKIKTKGEYDLKEQKLRGEYALQKQAMLSMGFNEDKDLDNDGIPDVYEIYKDGLDAEIKAKEVDIKEREQKFKEEIEREKLKLEKRKLDIEEQKVKSNKSNNKK